MLQGEKRKREKKKRFLLTESDEGGGAGGGGGFFLACEDFGRMFDNSFPTCAFFLLFLKWRLASAH